MVFHFNQFAVLFLLVFGTDTLLAQGNSNYAGPLTDSMYFENPSKYLQNLDSSSFGGIPLLDKTIYSDLMLNNNGTSRYTNLSYSDFYHIYQTLKLSEYHPRLYDFDSMLHYSNLMMESDEINVIGVVQCNTARINPEALSNGDLKEEANGIHVERATAHNFLTQNSVAATIFKHNFFGDEVKFLLDSIMIQSNLPDLNFLSAEIDFDNGEGFIAMPLNEIITIKYRDYSRYVNLQIKLQFENESSGQIESYKTVVNAWRKSPKDVAARFNLENRKIGEASYDGKLVEFVYPEPAKKLVSRFVCFLKLPFVGCVVHIPLIHTSYEIAPYSLEVSILFNAKNTSGKLRRPLVMVDGFDPGDKRDFWSTIKDQPMEALLPRERDDRGLYELLNGTKSPWDETSDVDAGLVSALQEDGYDIVFVNFKEGAGDIVKNANQLRNLFNDVLNEQYRDNKTEEIILIGPSMGGVITRIALTQMENEGEEHLVKSWISFDSPHKGANIPLALQHSINFGSKFAPSPSSLFASNPMVGALKKINSMAAKQLLVYHHLSSTNKGEPTIDFKALQGLLAAIGFPKYCKNFAISNGGKSALYNGRRQIIDFKATQWTYLQGYGNYNSMGTSLLFKGSRYGRNNDQEVYTSDQMALENSIGGWHSGLYTINYSFDNSLRDHWGTDGTREFEFFIHGQKATFIPTCSAFGLEINRSNLFKSHSEFTTRGDNNSGKIITPFDEIHGMEVNEEHGKISGGTAKHVREKWLQPDFISYTYPFSVNNEKINKVCTKRVAYVHYEACSFAGKGNTFTFKKGADAQVVTGKTIRLLPGFKVEKGARVQARIQEFPNYGSTLRKIEMQQNSNKILWSEQSKKNHNYSSNGEVQTLFLDRNWKVAGYPIPATEVLTIEILESPRNAGSLAFYDLSGSQILTDRIQAGEKKEVNLKNWKSGVYILEVEVDRIKKQLRIIKL